MSRYTKTGYKDLDLELSVLDEQFDQKLAAIAREKNYDNAVAAFLVIEKIREVKIKGDRRDANRMLAASILLMVAVIANAVMRWVLEI